jgi:RNase P subunit RPR2
MHEAQKRDGCADAVKILSPPLNQKPRLLLGECRPTSILVVCADCLQRRRVRFRASVRRPQAILSG